MAERLLTFDDIASRLKVDAKTVKRNLTRLLARGLQEVRLNRFRRFREASLDHIIKQAAERGDALI